MLVAQLYLILCDSMDCSPPGFSVHGILQARILEWLSFPLPGDLPYPGIKPTPAVAPALQLDCLPAEPLVMDVFINLILVIISQCIQISNHVVHLKCILIVSIISK